jgi:hypothetical protein
MMMIVRPNFALMEIENARRAADRAGRPALHPIAEFYGDWERERARRESEAREASFVLSLGDGGK